MADVLFVEYPKCSTCKKAKAWLDAHGVAHVDRHIVEDNPTAEELAAWHARSGLPLRRFFNTSGVLYRERNVKALLDAGMDDEAAFALLAENGMLVKRPIVVGTDFVLVGFTDAAGLAAARRRCPPCEAASMQRLGTIGMQAHRSGMRVYRSSVSSTSVKGPSFTRDTSM